MWNFTSTNVLLLSVKIRIIKVAKRNKVYFGNLSNDKVYCKTFKNYKFEIV